MFSRRKQPPVAAPPPPREPAAVFAGLRDRLLQAVPTEAGLAPTAALPDVWGVLFETGLGAGTASVVAVADGTTSLYLSSGGGIIGAGQHEVVRAANQRLLEAVQAHLALFEPEQDATLPPAGQVAFRALCYDGRRVAGAAEAALGAGGHALSPVFFAGHAVLTQLRLIDEARKR